MKWYNNGPEELTDYILGYYPSLRKEIFKDCEEISEFVDVLDEYDIDTNIYDDWDDLDNSKNRQNFEAVQIKTSGDDETIFALEKPSDLECLKDEIKEKIDDEDAFDKIRDCKTLEELKDILTENGAIVSKYDDDLINMDWAGYEGYCDEDWDEDTIYENVKEMILANHTTLETDCDDEDLFIIFDDYE